MRGHVLSLLHPHQLGWLTRAERIHVEDSSLTWLASWCRLSDGSSARAVVLLYVGCAGAAWASSQCGSCVPRASVLKEQGRSEGHLWLSLRSHIVSLNCVREGDIDSTSQLGSDKLPENLWHKRYFCKHLWKVLWVTVIIVIYTEKSLWHRHSYIFFFF